MKKILIVLMLTATIVSCKKESRNDECLRMYNNNDQRAMLLEPQYCEWLKDENNNIIINDDGTPIPNN